jgi:glutathione S-transferase
MENVWAHRSPEQRSQAWIDRQLEKISEALRAMSHGLSDKPYCSGAHLSLSDIAVGCALGYLDFRFSDIDWRCTYPNLDKLQAKLMQRQSFIDSLPK